MPGSRAGIGALTLGAVWCGPGLAPHLPPLARAMGVPLRVRRPGAVALTFDDGPHPEGTPAVLDALAARGAKATFFMVAEQVERYRSLAAEIVAAGHEAAVHGYRHRNQMRLLPHEFADDLRRATDLIGEVSGGRPRLYRPPYGIFTPVGLSLVRRASLQPLLWSRWGRDWRAGTDPQEIVRLVSRGLGEDDVVLLHDADWYSSPGSHRHTAAAVPGVLDVLEERGLRPVLAGDSVGDPG
ncbi:MAG TPA: polysaccharide deacetylase family protein [Solirubrobacteraceae bacterium]